jgi:hypothetical protein
MTNTLIIYTFILASFNETSPCNLGCLSISAWRSASAGP